MSNIKFNHSHLNATHAVDNSSSELSYTPCTCGAFVEQPEFDFGSEFSNPTVGLCSDTNSVLEQPPTHCKYDGFIGIKENTL